MLETPGVAWANKNYLWRKITSSQGSELRHGKTTGNVNGESMAGREPKEKCNKNSQDKLCLNHWMTDKTMYAQRKTEEVEGKKLTGWRESLHLNRALLWVWCFFNRIHSTVHSFGSKSWSPTRLKCQRTESKSRRTVGNQQNLSK